MNEHLNIRPIYYSQESWDNDPNNSKCKIYTFLNKPSCFVPTKKNMNIKNRKNKITTINDKCSICLESLNIMNKWARLSKGLSTVSKFPDNLTLSCTHKFHYKCILKWFKFDNTCPLCRKVV